MHSIIAIAAGTAAGITLLLTPWVRRVATRLGAVDRPVHRKQLSPRMVPNVGGVAVFAGAWGAIAAVSLLPRATESGVLSLDGAILPILGAGLLMLLVGLADGWWDLSARVKFVTQFLAAALVIGGGLVFTKVSLPGLPTLGLGAVGLPLTLVWLAGVTNGVNLIDGVDGLATGVIAGVAACTAVVAAADGQASTAVLAAAVAGAGVGFLPFNFAPARIFLGDGGSLFAGITLAALAMGATTERGMAPAVLLLGYPTLDTGLVVVRRLVAGRSPFSGDRGHIHHRLLGAGVDHRTCSVSLSLLALAFCLPGVMLALGHRTVAIVGCAVLLVGCVALAMAMGYTPRRTVERLTHHWSHKAHYLAARHRAKLASAELELADSDEERLAIVDRTRKGLGIDRVELRWAGHEDRVVLGAPACKPGAGGDTVVHTDRHRLRDGCVLARVDRVDDGLPEELQMEHRAQMEAVLRSFAKEVDGEDDTRRSRGPTDPSAT